nr:reverse transcriptase [Tanacetum cinerariifolium]
MFEKQAGVEWFDLIQTFHACKQDEGKPVGPHVLKMKAYVEQLERLGYVLSAPSKGWRLPPLQRGGLLEKECHVYLVELITKKKQVGTTSSSGDGSSFDEWGDYGVAGDDYEGAPIFDDDYEKALVFDDDQYEEESVPVYDTDIEDVIEEEEGFVEKGGFCGKEDCIEDVIVVANDLCSLMVQTTLNVDFREVFNTKSHELMSFGKNIIIKVSRSSFKSPIRKKYQENTPDKLQQRSVKCIFIGYPKKTMSYYFYFPPENKIVVASKIAMEVEGFKPPQEEVVPIHRSARTYQAPDRLCLNVEVEEHCLGDLNESTNYKAVLLILIIPVQRSIYGLKQASRSWNKRFDEEIKRFGFAQNLDEPCVYQKASETGFETDRDDTKSQTGYVFILNGGTVDWKSSKQSTTTMSATEVE